MNKATVVIAVAFAVFVGFALYPTIREINHTFHAIGAALQPANE